DRLRRQSAEMSLQQLMCQLEVSTLALGSDGKQCGIHALVADPGAVSDDDQLYGCRRLVAKGAGCPGIDGLCQGGRAVVHGRSDVMFGRRAFVACRALPIRKCGRQSRPVTKLSCTTRRAALGRQPFHCRIRVPACGRRNGGSGGADLEREDPGYRSRRPRDETMRHWITSFLLLMGQPFLYAAPRGFGRVKARPRPRPPTPSREPPR